MPNTFEIIAASSVRFGTSGARGLVAALTDQVCAAYTLAFLRAVAAADAGRVALGMDLRPSSPRIARACAVAVGAAGLQVECLGVLPTPALAYYARKLGIPALMITGSHIPYDRNGIKFYKADGEITKVDEEAINRVVADMPETAGIPALPKVNPDAYRCYVDRYLRFFPPNCLSGLRLGVYEHSGAARDMLREVFAALGAEVISLGRTDEFVPLDTEAISAADAERARTWVNEYDLDGIVTTDGDADRPLIGDENGEWLRGDIVGILCAAYLGADAVATPVSSNTAVEKCARFRKVLRTRIGSPYVIAGMDELQAGGERSVVGFEANGGFLLATTARKRGRVLDPLPTRDAVLPIVALFAMANERGVKLSALCTDLPQRFTSSDRLQNFPDGKSRALLLELCESPSARQVLWGDLCGVADKLDQTEGLRIFFKSGDIIFLRASGNAPELRCYAEAASRPSAERLVRETLARIAGMSLVSS